MGEDSRKILTKSLRDLVATGQYSDLTITCKSDTYKVHRNIVCVRAEFFAGASRFPGTESASNTIDLPDEDPAIVKLLIQYLYEGDYAPMIPDAELNSAAPSHESWIPHHLRPQFPHSCGFDYYTLEERDSECQLRVCAHHKCGRNCEYMDECSDFICSECVPTPSIPEPVLVPGMSPDDLLVHAKMYEVADRLLVTGLKALACKKFKHAAAVYRNDPAFPMAAEYVFSSTPESDTGLRALVGATIVKYMDLVKDVTIRNFLQEHPELAVAVLATVANNIPKKRKIDD